MTSNESQPVNRDALTRSVEDTKLCPMCGATIKYVARKCRFCGERFDGDLSDGGVWRLGNQLVMRKGARLPARCVKTNLPSECWLTRRLYWHHPLIYLLILGGVLLYVVAVLFIRQTAVVDIGLTRSRYFRRLWTILIAWLAALVGAGMSVAGLMGESGTESATLFVAGLMLTVLSAVTGAYFSAVVQPAKITREYVWLKGIHPAYLAEFPEFPGENHA